MKKHAVYPIGAMLLGVALLLTSGCTGTSKPSTFYLLSPLPESEQLQPAADSQEKVSILIGPVSMPAYLDRPNIVTRAGDNELAVAEFNRWAEPLKDNFFRVLVENLAVLLGTVDMSIYPQRISQAYDFQVVMAVTRFDTDAAGEAELAAFWFVLNEDGRRVLVRKRSLLRATAAGSDQRSRVAAQNRLLNDFSREIAEEIKKLR